LKKEKEIETLSEQLKGLLEKRDQLKPTPELHKLIKENEKLNYRINILKQVFSVDN
jgi:hypothetical protein